MADNAWYTFEPGDPLMESFDASKPIPEPGENEPLDSYCTQKHITHGDLVRVGGRMAQTHVLMFVYPGAGMKYRDLVQGRRWSSPGATFHESARIIPGSRHDALVVVEGESDAARMTAHVDTDVLITWAHEGAVPAAWMDAIASYPTVYLAHDDDPPGEAAAKKMAKGHANAVRWKPPAGDWCEVEGDLPALPEPAKPLPLIAWGDELHELEYPDKNSILGEYLLPEDGMLLLHAWKGNYKSWLTFDLMVALATGGSWAGHEAQNPELRALVVQLELNPYYYQERLMMLRDRLPQWQRKLYHNLGTWRPGVRGLFSVKSQKHREDMLETLVENEVKVVLFDPIRALIGGNSVYEQDTQMAVVEFYRQIMGEKIAVVTTHHDSKTSARTGGGSNLDMTAGDALAGTADAIVSVGLPKDDDRETSRRRNLHWTVRNGPPVATTGFAIEDDVLVYQAEAHGPDSDDVEDAPGVG